MLIKGIQVGELLSCSVVQFVSSCFLHPRLRAVNRAACGLRFVQRLLAKKEAPFAGSLLNL